MRTAIDKTECVGDVPGTSQVIGEAVMRIRFLVATLALLLPASLSAQRFPRHLPPGISRPQPAPLSPQPAPIARELAYRRIRLSVESYPLINYVQASGLTGGVVPTWTSFGTGTRADYRVTPYMSTTLDVTTSLLGGPAYTQTAEFGTRLRPEGSAHRLYPFIDLRAGYMSAFNNLWGQMSIDASGNVTPAGTYARFSQGFGGVFGAGMEYSLGPKWSLTSGASVMRNEMRTRSLDVQYGARSYALTMYRYTLGVRYNPVRVIRATAQATP